MELDSLRCEIDKIDKQICLLIEKRMETAKNIAEVKKEQNLPILNEKREEEVLKKVSGLSPKYSGLNKVLFSDIMSYSRILQGGIIEDKDEKIREEKLVIVSFETIGEIKSLFSVLRDFEMIGFKLDKLKIKENLLQRLNGEKGNYRFKLEFVGESISHDDMEKLSYFKQKINSFKIVRL